MGGTRKRFEWDELKANRNRRKHGISFEEAVTIFEDPLSTTISDPDHSEGEQRYIDLGLSAEGELLVVVFTQRADRIRIISSRRATARERRLYEEEPI